VKEILAPIFLGDTGCQSLIAKSSKHQRRDHSIAAQLAGNYGEPKLFLILFEDAGRWREKKMGSVPTFVLLANLNEFLDCPVSATLEAAEVDPCWDVSFGIGSS
jgi:hypothetical protein